MPEYGSFLSALFINMQIGPAYPACLDLDNNSMSLKDRIGYLLRLDFAGPTQHGCLHISFPLKSLRG
jgi:hypothetical protein